ncbi:MAG: pyruvate dehydrogenase (acetyl-transferring) E1 component subunit alpha [Pseudomonadales bacterium]|nr:pyruvate dehydrogenase (acetyl-transferring) E1 component subunit alpha [Pseudomonadales bacterium]
MQSTIQCNYTFNIPGIRYLLPDSSAQSPLPETISDELLIKAYQHMRLIRTFDQKAIALQRTGQLGTYPSCQGHEGVNTAIGLAMHQDDVFVPYYRDQATLNLRGVKLSEILRYWGGDERGSHYENCPQDLPNCVPIATQFCHAAGIASAQKIKGNKQATVVTGGDGSTSKGDFLEALNLAGAWHLPLVLVVINNQWAISTPREVQCNASTLAQKAIGAGIPGVVVDGDDFTAVYDQVHKALQRAYLGKGPTLIEAITYRLGDHTTADDATRYRAREEVDNAWKTESVTRLLNYLKIRELWSEEREQQWRVTCKETVDIEVKDYLNTPPDKPTAMFEHLYETLPRAYLAQYEELAVLSREDL